MSTVFRNTSGGSALFKATGSGRATFTSSIPTNLYAFTSFVFSNAGATGNIGPTYNQVKAAYSATSWTQNQSYLNVVTQGFQLWTVPTTGSYTIQAAGAAGGFPSASNGLGNIISSTFTFTQGQKLQVIVGQNGIKGTSSGHGGGGGSFVIQEDGTLILAASGGGGNNQASGSVGLGICGESGTSGTKDGGGQGTGGTNGNGGSMVGGFTSSYGNGGCGAGVLSNGGYVTAGVAALHGKGGSSYANGFLGGSKGGIGYTFPGGDGGFGGGGGGGGGNDSRACCGGGGGYSGGAGGIPVSQFHGGGGGGSYSTGTITAIGRCTSNGYVRITKN